MAYDAIMALGIAACHTGGRDVLFTPEQLFDAFLNVDFHGASGRIRIDRQTGSRYANATSSILTGLQLTAPNSNGTVGVTTYRAAEYSLQTLANGTDIVVWQRMPGIVYNYSGFTTQPPPPLPPLHVNYNHVHGAVMITFLIMAALILISAVACAIWTWLYRQERVIRASQPFFLIAICIGVVFMALSILALSAAQNPTESSSESSFLADLGCMGSWWLFAIGFSISISALVAKTWRVNKVRNKITHELFFK